jgi:hypothetical protein
MGTLAEFFSTKERAIITGIAAQSVCAFLAYNADVDLSHELGIAAFAFS